jgi:hypothetical protein
VRAFLSAGFSGQGPGLFAAALCAAARGLFLFAVRFAHGKQEPRKGLEG